MRDFCGNIMGFREVAIFNHNGIEDAEATLMRGALWHHGIASRVLSYSCFEKLAADARCLIVLTSSEQVAESSRSKPSHQPLLLAGRQPTLEFLQGRWRPDENEVLIYGEPYALLPAITKDHSLLDQSRGAAILGPLLDPREYRTPPTTSKPMAAIPIMTSVRCQKRCGYCSYGPNYAALYKGDFARRSRPWQNVAEEISDLIGQGHNCFSLLADQFLSADPLDNRELYALAEHWNPTERGRPKLTFTVSPKEVVQNKPLLKAMANSFQLYPRLSIDSFDNRTLALFGLNFESSTALEALNFLASLKLPLRINYIFVRPGMTLKGMKEEFISFLSLAEAISYLTASEKLLIAIDLFSESLRIMPMIPITQKGVREGYEVGLPHELLKVIVRLQNVMQEEIINFRPDDNHDPLFTIIKVGFKELGIWREATQ
jgi:hypothetical protein